MSATVYKYRPLKSPESIRLFRIQPDLADGLVSCTLEQYDGNIPPYNALSYYWGDPKHTRKIYLAGTRIGVHETLWEFLNQMQRSQETETWFWTDFLCLDQGCTTEIGQQVQRMGDIYAEARQTVSWLGCGQSSVTQHVKNLGRSLELIATRVSLKRGSVESFFAQLPPWSIIMNDRRRAENTKYELPKASQEVIQLGYGQLGQPLIDILSLPYWTRVWVVQEVARAKVIKLVFGSVSIEFEDLFLVYKCRVYHEAMTFLLYLKETSSPKVAIEARAAAIDKSLSVLSTLPLAARLDLQATKPVDRIYGLLGLLRLHEEEASSAIRSVAVDYNRPISSVFWDMVFACRISNKDGEDSGSLSRNLLYFVELLPLLADSLGCSDGFSPTGLLRYVGIVEDPPEKHMARLTSRIVSVFQRAGESIFADRMHDGLRRTPIRCSTRRGRFRQMPLFGNNTSGGFHAELASLFLDFADFNGVDELDQLRAAYIALKLAENMDFECGEWTCIPVDPQVEVDGRSHDENRSGPKHLARWRDQVSTPHPDMLAYCSLAGHEPHRCLGSSRFLILPDAGLSLRLELDEDGSELSRAYRTFSITAYSQPRKESNLSVLDDMAS